MVEVAFGLPFTVITMRAFIASIPREIDEAAIVDGAGPLRLFFQGIFPLLRSVIVTVVVVQSIFVFNDFQNPLYFLPGSQNAAAVSTQGALRAARRLRDRITSTSARTARTASRTSFHA